MSLEFMDNFSQYGTDEGNMLDGVYASYDEVVLSTDPDGVSGGSVAKLGGYNTPFLRKVLSSAQTTVGIAFRYWPIGLPESNGLDILTFQDAANSVQITLEINSTGTLSVLRGTSTVLDTTTVPVITSNAWNHIEMKVLFDQTVGTIEVRVNGVAKITLTGQDTCNTALVECSQLNLKASTSHDVYFKDLYVWNGGGSVHNDFVGDVKIVTLIPTTDVALNWTPSTGGVGATLIDESTPDDTDYISAVTPPPAAFTCELSNLNSDVVSVKGLLVFNRMLKTDGGVAQVRNAIVSNAIDGNGADRAITAAATYWMDAIELDPNTAAAWSPTAVNAARLKINRTL